MQRLFSHSGAAIEEVATYRSLNNIYVKNDGVDERSASASLSGCCSQIRADDKDKDSYPSVGVVSSFFLEQKKHILNDNCIQSLFLVKTLVLFLVKFECHPKMK